MAAKFHTGYLSMWWFMMVRISLWVTLSSLTPSDFVALLSLFFKAWIHLSLQWTTEVRARKLMWLSALVGSFSWKTKDASGSMYSENDRPCVYGYLYNNCMVGHLLKTPPCLATSGANFLSLFPMHKWSSLISLVCTRTLVVELLWISISVWVATLNSINDSLSLCFSWSGLNIYCLEPTFAVS